jgi:hypothetical protein
VGEGIRVQAMWAAAAVYPTQHPSILPRVTDHLALHVPVGIRAHDDFPSPSRKPCGHVGAGIRTPRLEKDGWARLPHQQDGERLRWSWRRTTSLAPCMRLGR